MVPVPTTSWKGNTFSGSTFHQTNREDCVISKQVFLNIFSTAAGWQVVLLSGAPFCHPTICGILQCCLSSVSRSTDGLRWTANGQRSSPLNGTLYQHRSLCTLGKTSTAEWESLAVFTDLKTLQVCPATAVTSDIPDPMQIHKNWSAFSSRLTYTCKMIAPHKAETRTRRWAPKLWEN